MTEELYQKYNNADRQSWGLDAIDSIGFVLGLQWKQADAQAQINANKPALSDNEITPAIEWTVANLTDNSPRFMAYGREKSDIKTANAISNLMEYIWYISKGNSKLKRSIRDALYTGLGSLMLYVDSNADWGKGELKIESLDPQYLYIDPNSKEMDSSDAAHILYVRFYNARQVKQIYPDFNLSLAESGDWDDKPTTTRYGGENQVVDSTDYDYTTMYRVIDRYTKTKVPMFRVWNPKDDSEWIFTKQEYIEFGSKPAAIILRQNAPPQYVTKAGDVEFEMNMYLKTGGSFHFEIDPNDPNKEAKLVPGFPNSPFAIPASYTEIQIVTMTDLLNVGILQFKKVPVDRIKRVLTIGRKEHYNEILPIENYPIVTFMRYHNRCPYPQGDVRLVKPLQQMLNVIDSIILDYNAALASPKAFIPRGTQNRGELEEKWKKSGPQLFEYDPELGGVPIVVQLGQMGNSLYQQRLNLINQIQRILGSYAVQDGNMDNAPRTKGGTYALLEAGSVRSRSIQADIEASINQLATVVSDYIPHVYDERKIIRVIKPNHKIATVAINEEQTTDLGVKEIVNDMTLGKCDLVMLSGSMLPTNRAAKSEYYLNLYHEGVLKDPTPILEMSEIENVDEIIAKQDREAQLQQALQESQKFIKDMQGQLQTLQRELIGKDQKVQVEKFTTKINKIANEAAAQAQISKARMEDGVRNSHKELASMLAGFEQRLTEASKGMPLEAQGGEEQTMQEEE